MSVPVDVSMLRRGSAVVVGALALLVCTNGPVLIPVRIHLDRAAGLDAPSVRTWFAAVAMLGTGLVLSAVASRRITTWSTSRAGLVVVAIYVGVIGLSTVWSVDRSLTSTRVLIYAGLAGFAWWFGASVHVDARAAVTLMAAMGVGASLVTLAFWRRIAIDPTDSTWRGLYTGRNSLAPIAAIAILGGASMALERRGPGRAALGASLAIASTVVLLGTGNKTAPLSLAIATAVPVGWGLTRRVARDRGVGAGRSGATALMLLAAAVMWPAVDAVWSTGTFVTRRGIWSLVRSRIADRPLQGYGFTVLWDVPAYSADLYARVGTVFGSAHNSWLETWLGAGVAGVIAYSLVVGVALWNVARGFRGSLSVTTAFWLILVIFLVLENLTESFVLWHSYNWVLITVAALRRPASPEAPDPASARRPAQSRVVRRLSPPSETWSR